MIAIAKQTRNPATITSNSFAVPKAGPNGFSAVVLLNANDLADPGLTVRVAVEASYDGQGLNWAPLAGALWSGGQVGRDGQFRPPSLTYSTSGPRPLFLRGSLDWNQRVSLGLDVSLLA